MIHRRTLALLWLLGPVAWAAVQWFGHPFLARAWTNTLALGLATMVVAVPIGFALAWLLMRVRPPGARLALAITAAWMLMPLYLQAGAWQAVLDRFVAGGTVGSWRRGLPSGMWGAWWVHVAAAIPWCSAAMGWALWLLPRSWEEQAALDPHPRRAWWLATWPYWLAATSLAATWVFLTVTTEITASDLFQVETLAEVIYLRFALGLHADIRPLSWESALMLSWLAALVVTGMRMALSPIGEAVERRHSDSATSSPQLGLALLLGAILFMFVGIPIGVLAYQAGMEVDASGTRPDMWVRHWSAVKLAGVVCGIGPDRGQWVAWQFGPEWGWSVAITSAAALVSTVSGSLIAYGAYRFRWVAWAVVVIIGVWWSIPGPQWGLWMASFWTSTDWRWMAYLYDHTPIPPVLAGVIRSLPASIAIWWGGFRALPPRLVDALKIEGWGVGRQWLWVALPARKRLMWVVGLISGAMVFGDVGITMPIIPPGMLTITIRVFDLLHAGVDDLVAGICLLLILGGTALVGLISWRLRSSR